jgi:cyclopropane fatty-acyl-phospholipid synthase-like methyltransferase
MTEIELMISFYKDIPRQGPGSSAETLKALHLTRLDLEKSMKVADIGCGTGTQTFTLAENIDGQILAVDLFPEFLEKLKEKMRDKNLQSRITTDIQSMNKLPYENSSFDLIWSEGAIYIMGFEEGVKAWRRLIKNDGFLVVSEISWFTDTRPELLETYWLGEYPQMDNISNKEKILENSGYKSIASFKLPEYCWMENYYQPIRQHIPEFLEKNKNSHAAQGLVDELIKEIEMYEKYKDFYGYGFYIAQKK